MDSSFSTFDWLLLPVALSFPPPDPAGFAADSWHQPDVEQAFGFSDFPAAPTPSRVEWMGFDPRTPAGDATEDTLASIVEAYRSLPNRLAAESIILAHVPYVYAIVSAWMNKHLGEKAARLEQCGRRAVLEARAGKKTKIRGGATIAEDLFSIGLLTLSDVVASLRDVGHEGGWDDWDAPGRIASYVGNSVKYAIKDYLRTETRDHKRTGNYLAERESRRDADGRRIKVYLVEPKGAGLDQVDEVYLARPHVPCKRTKDEKKRDSLLTNVPCAVYHAQTPAMICQAIDNIGSALDRACEDVIDRLLLTMKREGILSEVEMGWLVGLSRDQVHRRLSDLYLSLEANLGLLHRPTCKRRRRRADRLIR